MTLNKETLTCIEINPSIPAKKSIIWLHGLGADGTDFVPIVPELHLPASMGVRFVFPHAPVMPVTINNGVEMRAWFDILSLSMNSQVDAQGITRSVASLEELIAKEIALGIKSENIILAGFSQGSVIALTTGLCYPQALGGLIALSGFLPFAAEILKKASAVNKHIPIFIAHGTQDSIVPFALGEATSVALKEAGYPVSWHRYPMPHSVCSEEISDLSRWLQER